MSRPLVVTLILLIARAAAGEELSAEAAVSFALDRNSELAALASEVKAADARVGGAKLLFQLNPELTAAAGPRRTGSEESTDLELEVTQRLELFGQRGARIEAAVAEREAAAARLAARRVEVCAAVRGAHARALAAERLLAVARDDLTVTRDAVRAAERRAELGGASRLEVNAARGEVGRAARAVSVATVELASARSELRLLLAMDPAAELTLGGALPEVTQLHLQPVDALAGEARQGRADVVAARRAVASAEAERRLSGREALPSPVVGARYAREERADILLGTLSLDLPLFNRNQAGRGVASARADQAAAELAGVIRRADQDVRLAAERLAAAMEAAHAFEGEVVAGAEENLTLSTRAYEAGKIGLAELLLMRRSAMEARREHVEALSELAEAEAELARAVGSEKLLTRVQP